MRRIIALALLCTSLAFADDSVNAAVGKWQSECVAPVKPTKKKADKGTVYLLEVKPNAKLVVSITQYKSAAGGKCTGQLLQMRLEAELFRDGDSELVQGAWNIRYKLEHVYLTPLSESRVEAFDDYESEDGRKGFFGIRKWHLGHEEEITGLAMGSKDDPVVPKPGREVYDLMKVEDDVMKVGLDFLDWENTLNSKFGETPESRPKNLFEKVPLKRTK